MAKKSSKAAKAKAKSKTKSKTSKKSYKKSYKKEAYINPEAERLQQIVSTNNISTPFFAIDGGRLFRTADLKPYGSHEEYFADGGASDWSNVTSIA